MTKLTRLGRALELLLLDGRWSMRTNEGHTALFITPIDRVAPIYRVLIKTNRLDGVLDVDANEIIAVIEGRAVPWQK